MLNSLYENHPLERDPMEINAPVTTIGTTTIVYNKFNHDAVIAAAILKTEIPNSMATDVSQLVTNKSDTYIWLGLVPSSAPGYFNNTIAGKEHIVIVDKAAVVVMKKRSFFSRVKEIEVSNEEECVSEYTLIHAVCDKFELTNQDYKKLAFHVAHFHLRNTEVEYLAFVYSNLQCAENCLRNGEIFKVKHSVDEDTYINDVNAAKRQLNKNYRYKDIRDGSGTRTVFYTTMDGFGFHLVLRLIKLVHQSFMNTTMGMNGHIVYTNMKNLTLEDKGDPYLVLN